MITVWAQFGLYVILYPINKQTGRDDGTGEERTRERKRRSEEDGH